MAPFEFTSNLILINAIIFIRVYVYRASSAVCCHKYVRTYILYRLGRAVLEQPLKLSKITTVSISLFQDKKGFELSHLQELVNSLQ